MGNIWLAFGLTCIAGLSTGIGSLIAFFAKKTNTKFLSISLGFSAGVMIYVSMIEIFPKAAKTISQTHGEKNGVLFAIIAFFLGMFLIGIIDKMIPSEKNPHEVKFVESENEEIKRNKLKRMGVLTALAVAIHNFPEGLATFVAALQEPKVAIPIVAAIAIHNIPEGIAVSVPIYYATGSKRKAFLYSFASGLSEPVGALVGYLILMPFMNDTVFGILYASVAGIMVFISIDELLPSAREYGEHHLSIYGMIAGMIVMALSLWLFI
ncbi:MAG: zinc transporter ZupT [Clostridia bacterium]|jgi:ZIP family zinc transporter|nr:zinc transporter ZupT [Clostridia bacterium]NLF37552.1 zinc transporter ZupT [Clostridiaceae bacterium]